jgi:seryl-tRNA synthetase
MPRELNPNSKYAKRKAAEAEKRRIETEAIAAERRRIAEKEAELEQKARELEEKTAETLRIKAENEAKQQQNNVVTDSENVALPNETDSEMPIDDDDLFAQLNAVLSETKEPTDQNIIEKAADDPDMFDDSLGDADTEFPDIEIPMDDADDAEQIEMGLPADETSRNVGGRVAGYSSVCAAGSL